MRRRKIVWHRFSVRFSRVIGLLVLSIGVVGAAWWSATPSPLEQLERRVQAIPTWQAGYRVSSDDAMYWQARELEHVVSRLFRMEVQYGTPPIAWAVGVQQSDRIVVDASLHWTARLEVLAHEAGHLFMPPTFPPQSSESEVFAEAVSHLVCARVGHPNLEVSARYLAVHKQALHVLRAYRAEIEFAADTLTLGNAAP